MDDRLRALHGERVMDPNVAERFVALERVQRARRLLEHERELAAEVAEAIGAVEATARHHDPAEVDHLKEIHRSLVHERSRRFGKDGREIASLELAERLVLERLGYVEYEEFEAAVEVAPTDGPVIDLVRLARLEDDLAAAEAELAHLTVGGELDVAPPLPRRPRRSSTAVSVVPTGRATATRRQVFGGSTGWAPDRKAMGNGGAASASTSSGLPRRLPG